MPHELFNIGYKTQTCVDFSSVVIEQMRERYAADTGVRWECADVRSLPFPDRSYDVAFDKGTLDAMIYGSPWNPPDEVKENTNRYMNEVAAQLHLLILKANGSTRFKDYCTTKGSFFTLRSDSHIL